MKKKEYPKIEENINQLAEPMSAYSLSDATVSEEEMDDETFDKILSTFPRMWAPSSEEEAIERIKSIEEESERTGVYYDETSFWEEIRRRRLCRN